MTGIREASLDFPANDLDGTQAVEILRYTMEEFRLRAEDASPDVKAKFSRQAAAIEWALGKIGAGEPDGTVGGEDPVELREFHIALRQDLIEVISGVKDAGVSLNFDDTTPNSTIRSRLKDVYNSCLAKVPSFGVFVVTRHTDCPNKNHQRSTRSTHGFATSNTHGLDIPYGDEHFIWYDQLFQGERHCICPCSARNEPTRHHVIDDVLFAPAAPRRDCETLFAVLSDVHEAIERANDNRPRAAIRENLLRAVLRLNDAILPWTVEEFIANGCEIASDTPS